MQKVPDPRSGGEVTVTNACKGHGQRGMKRGRGENACAAPRLV